VDPWLYTPALMHDRPDGEAAGMIGTIIFILVGWPGLVMSCTGASLLLGRRIAGRRARLAQAASSSTPA
jgi:uncharacterized iron-regulated membrane protein